MTHKKHSTAENLMGSSYEAMDERTKKVVRHINEHKYISRDTSIELEDAITFGQRAADAVARFGGSWSFIMLFAATLIFWVILNSYILASYHKTFDPYPYILLNLFLSMLASIQAPIILMSQNRQGERDRLNANHDYEVNLKAELEIRHIQEKLDYLLTKQWQRLSEMQQMQMELMQENLLQLRTKSPRKIVIKKKRSKKLTSKKSEPAPPVSEIV
ncbi:MAG: DUF1003 domain-containing protein [Pseudomonadota bacterium]